MSLIIVESPAKARTIERYLGGKHHVIASYGHMRDLLAKDGAVKPDQDFAMSWEVNAESLARLEHIAKAIKKTDRLILATDPDREGEAIAWHLLEMLEERKLLKDVEIERVVFNAITKDSVLKAMDQPRKVDSDLVDAYLARRALDYLFGFTLSPVLWRKLPGVKSAGRVQSAALRFICEREEAREAFTPQDFWTIDLLLSAAREKSAFMARLTAMDGEKLEKFTLKNDAEAEQARRRAEIADWIMVERESKPMSRRPAPPFTTSTLQQEAARKLGFAAARTMRAAQKLYDGSMGSGLITYMRTDGVAITPEALRTLIGAIKDQFGAAYLPKKPHVYKARAKNAQEAHEAIRPTDISRLPDKLKREKGDSDETKLYELIWKRTMASQMAAAQFQQTTLTLHGAEKTGADPLGARATGRVLTFDGFLKIYLEGQDEKSDAEEEANQTLPDIEKGSKLTLEKAESAMHTTQPPPRFTEASLIKRMEELGIGRPSTYAPILNVLRQRNYIVMEKKQLVPDSRGRILTAFLKKFFERYVDYHFTAGLEEQLDHISSGKIDWKSVLAGFWEKFMRSVDDIAELRISNVLDYLNEALAPTVFPEESGGHQCPKCGTGRLSIRIGRYGAFVGCGNYPDCNFTRALIADGDGAAADRELGADPESGMMISVKNGRFGPYVERALMTGEKKPKRMSIPQSIDLDTIDLELALKLLALPRLVGEHPEDQEPIMAGIGRFGAYVKHHTLYASLESPEDALTVGLNRALSALAEKKANPRARKAQGKALGEHPKGGAIQLLSGRYGPYVKHEKVNASIPDDISPEAITLEEAISLIDARRARGPAGGAARRTRGAAKRKTAKKKAAKKKTAARKTNR